MGQVGVEPQQPDLVLAQDRANTLDQLGHNRTEIDDFRGAENCPNMPHPDMPRSTECRAWPPARQG